MNDVELQIAVATVMAELKSGFLNVERRFDAQARELGEIKSEVKRTNGRVTKLETDGAVRDGREKESSPVVTWETAKTFGQFGGWVLVGLFGFLKLIGKL